MGTHASRPALKWVKRIGIAVGLLVFAAAVVFWLLVDQRVDRVIEESISIPGKVSCEVGRVHLSLINGRVRVRDFRIGNPKGYSSADMVSLDDGSMAIKVRSLWNQPIRVYTITVIRPKVRLEDNLIDTNVLAFTKNLRKHAKQQTKAKAEQAKRRKKGKAVVETVKPPHRLVVDRLEIRDGIVEVGSGFSKAGLAVELPPIIVYDLRGKDDQGLRIGELAGTAVGLMVKQAALQTGLNITTLLPEKLSEALKKAYELTPKPAE